MDRHLLFDCALHPDEPDSELIFEQFADGSDATISQVIDVISFTDALAHLENVANDVHKIASGKGLLIQTIPLGFSKFYVCLQPANTREVELPLVKKHPAEQIPRGQNRWRIPRAHLAVDLEDRIARSLDRILL